MYNDTYIGVFVSKTMAYAQILFLFMAVKFVHVMTILLAVLSLALNKNAKGYELKFCLR